MHVAGNLFIMLPCFSLKYHRYMMLSCLKLLKRSKYHLNWIKFNSNFYLYCVFAYYLLLNFKIRESFFFNLYFPRYFWIKFLKESFSEQRVKNWKNLYTYTVTFCYELHFLLKFSNLLYYTHYEVLYLSSVKRISQSLFLRLYSFRSDYLNYLYNVFE